jgi:hypothetical protein
MTKHNHVFRINEDNYKEMYCIKCNKKKKARINPKPFSFIKTIKEIINSDRKGEKP